jgi:microcystin-dependent protein
MAGLRISQLPAATAIASADLLPFSSVSGSQTRRITANNLALALGLLGTSVGPTQPSTPANGQLWVDTSSNPPLLKVWNGATFTIVSFQPGASIITSPSGTAPSSPALGQLWQDTAQTPDELKMWDGTNWVRVDPDGIDQTFADARYLQSTTAASTYLALAGGTMTGNLTLVGNPSTTNMAANKGYVDTQVASITPQDMTPAGTIIWSARNTAPTGYLKANGAAISRTTYATLFSAIGTTFGSGDGSTTFNVPDLRGEFARGWDDGRGIDTGRTFGSAQASANLAHTHGITDPGHAHTVQYNNGAWNTGTSGNTAVAADQGTSPRATTTVSTGITVNSSGDTEARPRNIALLACIKT